MKVQDLRPYIRGPLLKEIEERETHFQHACMLSKMAAPLGKMLGDEAAEMVETHRIACQEAAKTGLLIDQVFGIGILSLDKECYSDYAENTAINREIIEYLQLVQTGIISWLDCHHISGIKEEPENEER